MNYPELGQIETQRIVYGEGAVLVHPSGAIYQRLNGSWVLQSLPSGRAS